jgi:hypothetical protein
MCVVEERGEDVGYKSTSVANDVALAVSFARFFFRQSHSDTEKGGGERKRQGCLLKKKSFPCPVLLLYPIQLGFFLSFYFIFYFGFVHVNRR